MLLACPSCRATIPAEDVHLPSGRAKCRACNAVFRLAGGVPGEASAALPRLRIPRPADIVESGGAGGVAYHRRWWGLQFIFVAFFAVVWNAFLVLWYAMAIGGGSLTMLVFPVLHVAAGVGVAYYAMCGFVNRTVVRLERERLTVRHGPLPWPGNRDLPIPQIRQLYSEMHTHRSRNGSSVTYRLSAILDDGSSVKLLSGIPSAAVPRFLEQELEERMGIVNVPVAGELAF